MEKLIELLNKYYFEIGRKTIIERYDDYDKTHYGTFRGQEIDKSDYPYAILWGIELISKKFRFIQRLVENNKIDKDKVIELEHNGIRPFKLDNLYGEIKLEERLLMLLSIQDNPIEFLISILK